MTDVKSKLAPIVRMLGRSFKMYLSGRCMPVYLIFFITSRCVSKCPHCFNWQRPHDESNELTIDEIEKISESIGDLGFVFLTGGEPHLRDDMPEIARIFYLNNHPLRIQSVTSGYDPDRILRNVKRILEYCPSVQFGQTVSFDAVGQDHDALRGVDGLFERAVETFKGLQQLERKYPNLSIGNPVTVHAFNQEKVMDLYLYLRDQLGSHNIFCNLVRGKPRQQRTKRVDLAKYRRLAKTIDADLISQWCRGYGDMNFGQLYNAKNILIREIVYRTHKNNRHQITCLAGRLAGVIYENGDVHPCEMISEKFGNLRERDYDMKSIWHSESADKIRERIWEEKCFCTHECFLTTSLLFNPYWLLRCGVLAFRLTLSRLLRNYKSLDVRVFDK